MGYVDIYRCLLDLLPSLPDPLHLPDLRSVDNQPEVDLPILARRVEVEDSEFARSLPVEMDWDVGGRMREVVSD